MLRPVASLLAAALLVFGFTDAQSADLATQREQVNGGVVGVLGGPINGTYSALAWDMATVLDSGYDLRVLPILGQGSLRAVEDLLLLKGVDVALVQADVLDFYKRTNVYPGVEDSVRYITSLYEEEVHIVAKQSVKSIGDLQGKKVNFGPEASGTFMTASVIFDLLGVTTDVSTLPYDVALDKLRKGEIDAFVRVAGKPVSLISEIEASDGLHILPISGIEGSYSSTTITNADYAELIPAGQEIETVAVRSVMAAYNWQPENPRFAKVQRFVDALRQNIDQLRQEPHHKKWKDVNLDEPVPGWRRWNQEQAKSGQS